MKLSSILAAGVLVALAAWPAHAEPSPLPLPQPGGQGSNAVGACLEAGEVWLLVVDDHSRVLGNQCVGTPSSGEEALRLAGIPTETGRQGYLCSLDDHPPRCPSTFDGAFWAYHQATAGGSWRFSDVGAAAHRPQPGTIEGWCYTNDEEARCTPPALRVVIDGQLRLPPGVTEADLADPAPAVRAPLPPAPPVPWTTVASAGAVAVVIGAAVAVARRRPDASADDLGGR